MLFLGLKMNNKNIIELEEIFHNIVKKHNLEIHCGGINNGKIFLEDGLPWVEFYGSFTKVSAKKFLQELSNEMNINIVFNRLESDIKDKSTLYAILDISPAFVFSQNIPPFLIAWHYFFFQFSFNFFHCFYFFSHNNHNISTSLQWALPVDSIITHFCLHFFP